MASADLTDLAALKQFLEQQPEGAAPPGAADDELLEALITSASVAIGRYANREFTKTDSTERRFAHRGGRVLNLAPFDLRAVTEISVDNGTQVSALVLGEFGLRPLPSRDGVFEWIELETDPGRCEVVIDGDWGFASVPADVAHLTKATVTHWLRRGIYALASNFGEEGAPENLPELLPYTVRGGLAPFRRVTIA